VASSREVTPWSGNGGDGSRGRLGIVALARRVVLFPLLPIDDDGSDNEDNDGNNDAGRGRSEDRYPVGRVEEDDDYDGAIPAEGGWNARG